MCATPLTLKVFGLGNNLSLFLTWINIQIQKSIAMGSFQAQSSRLYRQNADHASLGARLSIGFTTDNNTSLVAVATFGTNGLMLGRLFQKLGTDLNGNISNRHNATGYLR